MGVVDFFTNRKQEDKADVGSPAFSLTKVQLAIGTLIGAIVAVVPAALKNDETIYVAAIAAATVLVLGMLALTAVDIKTRQKAAEAKLRFGDGKGEGSGGANGSGFFAVPDADDLRLQVGSSSDEYSLSFAQVDGDKVTLYAKGHGKTVAEPLQQPPRR